MRAAALGNWAPFGAPPSGIARVASLAQNLGTNGGFTSTIDTTGANFLVIGLASYFPGGVLNASNISDNYGNTWIGLTPITVGNFVSTQMFFAYNASTGPGHFFSIAKVGTYIGAGVVAYSGVFASGLPFDTGEGDGATAGAYTSFQIGTPVTPSQNNSLLVAVVDLMVGSSLPSIDDGFSVAATVNSNGNEFGIFIADQVQTTATARDPTFSWVGVATSVNALNVAFKPM